jgi:hypothetical protein
MEVQLKPCGVQEGNMWAMIHFFIQLLKSKKMESTFE